MNNKIDRDLPKTWWGPVWRGLVVDADGRHYRRMDGALWLFLYLIIHADRRTGYLTRRHQTISRDMGVSLSTVRKWLARLRRGGYLSVTNTGRALKIHIAKWKPLSPAGKVTDEGRAE